MKKKSIIISVVMGLILILCASSVGVMANDYLNKENSALNEFVDYPYKGNVIVKTAKPSKEIKQEDTQPKVNNIALAESLYKDLNQKYPNHKINVYLITGGQYKKDYNPQPKQQFITVDFDKELIEFLKDNTPELISLNNYVAKMAQQLDDSLQYGNPIQNDQIIISNAFNKSLLDRRAEEYSSFTIQHSKHTNIQKMLGGTYYE